MKKFLFGMAVGMYGLGALATFIFVGFFTLLGGRADELWKPFAYAIGWPLFWLWILLGL